jgi:hypothetical protein
METIPLGDLSVDRRVQRGGLQMGKLEKMKRDWNPAAEGVYTVSRRKDRSIVILDGAHRWTVKKELTDNQGTAECRVFENLTEAEEAEIFLALNNTTQPLLLDKFRVRVVAGDEVAVAINDLVKAYGWSISRMPGNANIAAVQTLEKLYKLSLSMDAEPNLLQMALLTITNSWGLERDASAAVIIEGIGRVYGEYKSLIDVGSLVDKLKNYRGGPATLHAEATQLARMRGGRVSMAVAELVVDEYNKNKKTKALHRWSRRA